MSRDSDTSASTRPMIMPVEVWLSKPQQLINSFDPSPFYEKDLDKDAEEYVAR